MITVFSGIRDLDDASLADVELVVADEVVDAAECRFGGALGVDTAALLAACEVAGPARLKVFVPDVLARQPREARNAVERCADEIVELHLPIGVKRSFLDRNEAMLAGADRLVAFTDGRATGGTAYTIRRALERRIDVSVVPVLARQRNPEIKHPDLLYPVYAFEHYVSLTAGGGSGLTKAIYAMKGGLATPGMLDSLADDLTAFMIQKGLTAQSVAAIVPMPRRLPGSASDMLPLAARIGQRLGLVVLEDWLVRTAEPSLGGFQHAGRTHYHADEHARTLAVIGAERPGPVLLLDNVFTFSGTMVGAQRAVVRDAAHAAPGLALACSGQVTCEGPDRM